MPEQVQGQKKGDILLLGAILDRSRGHGLNADPKRRDGSCPQGEWQKGEKLLLPQMGHRDIAD